MCFRRVDTKLRAVAQVRQVHIQIMVTAHTMKRLSRYRRDGVPVLETGVHLLESEKTFATIYCLQDSVPERCFLSRAPARYVHLYRDGISTYDSSAVFCISNG
jgi:hypothetical protein